MSRPSFSSLILLRHGQSVWNLLNLFTGWVDIPLSPLGIEEALMAGEFIAKMPIDEVHTSTLSRAIMTAYLAMSRHGSKKTPLFVPKLVNGHAGWNFSQGVASQKDCIPMYQAWELNERMYGDLQGLNKAETIEKYGKEQVQIWRRSFATPPPNGESLKMTAERTLPYFTGKIVPALKGGKNILVSAHGNSLRSILMEIRGLDEKQVVELEIPTGVPIVLRYEDGKFHEDRS